MKRDTFWSDMAIGVTIGVCAVIACVIWFIATS